MTKSTITREESVQAIFDLKVGYRLEFADIEILKRVARMALAAMDSEPVAEVYQAPNVGICAALGPSIRMLCPLEPGTNLYRHPQPAPVALVVPDEMTPEQAHEIGYYYGDPVDVFARGANWMRQHIIDSTLAAATQSPGSEPATVPGKWIPVSERMPPPRYEVLVGRWWGEKPRWCCKWATYIPGHPDSQSSGWLIPGASWTPTHWMPLPAAPQEVK